MEGLQAPRLELVDELAAAEACAPRIKRLVPALPPWYVRRPALERKLDQAGDFRLTAVVAGAGFGKTTQLAARAHARHWAWYTVDERDASPVILWRGLRSALRERLPALADAQAPAGARADAHSSAGPLAAALAESLEPLLEDDLVLVVDDVHELDGAPAVRLLESLTRYAPAELHLVLSSRAELPFPISRLRGQGEVLDVDAAELVFTPAEVAAFLAGVVGDGAEELAGPVREATGGWPAEVQLAAATLAATDPSRRPDAAVALARRRGPLLSYLAEEVFGREPAEVRRVVRTAAEFDRVTPGLCEALGLSGADEVLRNLARRGLVLEPPVGSGDWYSLHALVRQFAREYWTLNAAEVRELQLGAAGWLEGRGMLPEALDSLAAAGDADGIARLLSERGQELNSSGAMASVVRAATFVPPACRSQRSALTVAYAHIWLGDYDQAREWLSAVDVSPDDPSVSFNLAVMHVNRAEAREALAVLEEAEAAGCDEPMHNCLIAYVLFWLGRLVEARSYGERALAGAGSEPPTPLSDAHGVLGHLALVEGDFAEAEAHFDVALEIAERVGNVISTSWSRTRLAELRLEQGRYAEALEEATRALELSDRVGVSAFQAVARADRGFALLGLGRLDEASADFSAAVAVHERIASAGVAEPLIGMGTVQAERGELSRARSSFERAAAAAERSGIVYLQADALAGLARVVVDEAPDESERLVREAAGVAGGVAPVGVTLAGGWIALRRGDRDRARSAAESALAEARRGGAPALLAEALELAALGAAKPEAELGSLQEAVAIWREIGNPVGKAKAELALTRLGGSDEAAVRAEEVLRDLGVRPAGGAAGILLSAGSGHGEPLAIQTLGRFAVLRDGEAVPVGEWRSRKARDLLRLLVTRRASSTPRDFLMEALWPNVDPVLTSNRLSVALNVVRNVLDPQHRFEPDHYVASTSDGIRLEHVPVDVEHFLEKADRALRLSEAEGPARAVTLLEEAASAYGGDFLEEDRYEDWAAPLREEARSAYLDVLRALASASESAGRSSARYHLRILALDPFDEEAHLGLVSSLSAAGRHGEARRAYRRYVERMDEIGVEPAPRPGR